MVRHRRLYQRPIIVSTALLVFTSTAANTPVSVLLFMVCITHHMIHILLFDSDINPTALVAMRVNAVWGRRKWVSMLLWGSGILYIAGTLGIISAGIFQVVGKCIPPLPEASKRIY